jgi:ubiquinone/menaquinone biosynthesis C-methylase UbiE
MRDETIQCVDCSRTFVWSIGEQRYFKEHGLTAPKRCPDCRAHKRVAREPGMRGFSGPPPEFMDASPEAQVQADFDRIALLSTDEWGENSHYHSFLLKHTPSPCAEALDIGCGTGSFARLLAQRCKRVLALDLSPQMIRVAQERSTPYTSIDFRVADVTTWQFPAERFDCIASIATLHHLPFEETLVKMKHSLKVGGALLVLDLFQEAGLFDALVSAIALPVDVALRLVKRGRLRESAEVRAAWDEHGRHDSYLTLPEIRKMCADILPGASVTRHLLWRYSIIWKKETDIGRIIHAQR